MTLQYKGITPVVKALDDQGQGQAIIVQLNVADRDNDVTLPLSFGEQHVKVLFGHDWKQPAIGDARLYEQDNYVLADFSLNLNMTAGREVFESLKWDVNRHRLQEWSYGYQVLDAERGVHEGKSVRFLKKVHAFEISPVVAGAGIGTGTLSLKSARHYSPGGFTPMKSHKEHVSAAVTSLWSGMRHLHHVRRELSRSPSAVKADPEFDVAFEHIESALDSLNDALLVPAESTLLPVTTEPLKAMVAVLPEPAKASTVKATEDGATETTEPSEKGGMPIHDDLEQVMQSVERVTERLEQVKGKRAEESVRYPHGRPMSPERLGQVEALQMRLSRLKVSTEQSEQQAAEQQDLHEMTERLKRLGVSVPA